MATLPVVKSGDGTRTTVNDLVKFPRMVPRRVLSLMDQQFIMETVLRNAGSVPSGALVYEETAPQFADDDPLITEEGGEIPTLETSMGQKLMARTTKRTGAIVISRENRSRNQIDPVQQRLRMVRNTFVRAFENLFLNAFMTHAGVQTMAASGLWSLNATRIRDDLAEARLLVEEATPDGRASDFLGYSPDTLIISNRTAADFLKSDDIAKVFVQSSISDQNPQYKGAIPGQFFGLRVLKSRQLDPTKAILLESRTVGGYADEYPLEATALYERRERQMWRSDVTRSSTVFLDNPKAAVIITAVGA